MNKHERTCKDACLTHSDPSVREAASKVWPAPRKRNERERASVKAKGEKRQGRREKVAAIREAVMARAGGRCECREPGVELRYGDRDRCTGIAVVMDHWLGGSGRRRVAESFMTCWALCRDCDRHRTANHPSAEFWNGSFQAHCEVHGYPFTPHYDARAACRATRAKENA